jgi:diguanylate cyclase (GGDEF)-like protein
LQAPLTPDNEAGELEVTIAGRSYTVTAGRRQMLNLLLSTYNGAVQRNRELLETQLQLQAANERLAQQQTRLEEANLKLQELAIHDALTGLRNRRAFNEKIEEELDRVNRYGQPLSLILLDLDHFKKLNDTYGHQIGDETLVVVSYLLKQCARDSDFVARYGGEEFAVILPNSDAEGALASAERMRCSIEQEAWIHRPITSSFGVATCTPTQTVTCTSLIQAADAALYAAKANGRNCVVHAGAMDTATTS